MKPVTWSFSRLQDFERCKFYFKLKHLDKVQEPLRPLPPGKTEYANDRGTRIHKAAEDYVRGEPVIELVPELQQFAAEFAALRTLHAEGKASLEGEWGYDENWTPCAWFGDNVWLRVKLDALVIPEPTTGTAIDYKTGKRAGNEVKHNEQMSLYSLSTFLRYPDLEELNVELWYIDLPDLVHQRYTRDAAMRNLKQFNSRGLRLTGAEAWPATPNQYTCRFCMYGPRGSGDCKVGV